MTDTVVFDLWRTLVPLSTERKQAATAAVARVLNEEGPDFPEAWASTRNLRETRPLTEYMDALRQSRGASWSNAQMRSAMEERHRIHYGAFAHLRDGARATLLELRRRGVRCGLVSNCSSDVAAMLRNSELGLLFDAVILSAEVGVMKPDEAIFEQALEALGTDHGWYVGDGDDGELLGARAAGFTDVLLDLGEGRSGSRQVQRIEEVLELIGGEKRE